MPAGPRTAWATWITRATLLTSAHAGSPSDVPAAPRAPDLPPRRAALRRGGVGAGRGGSGGGARRDPAGVGGQPDAHRLRDAPDPRRGDPGGRLRRGDQLRVDLAARLELRGQAEIGRAH